MMEQEKEPLMIRALGVCKGHQGPIYAIWKDINYDLLWICRNEENYYGPFSYPEDWPLVSTIFQALTVSKSDQTN